MKIHEYQARELFRNFAIPTSNGALVLDLQHALNVAKDVGYPIVLKSQVLVGGRGKAGGIKIAKSAEDIEKFYPQLQKLIIKDYPVKKIYLAKAVDILKEYYMAVTIDPLKGDAVVILSAAGGIDIEDVAKTNPDAIKKFYLQGRAEADASLDAFVAQVFSDEKQAKVAADIAHKLVKMFFALDCSLAEINPLVVDQNLNVLAIDAKVIFDDNALYRHPELLALRDMDYEDVDELEAKEAGLSFVKLDGNVGCIVNGAGLAMGTMDAVKLSGGAPANFLDVGGSSNPQKVLNALKIILRNKSIKAILINIFGGITRCDDIATGILKARKEIDLPVPLVVRLTGTNEDQAKAMLRAEGMEVFSSMREAVQKVVSLAK